MAKKEIRETYTIKPEGKEKALGFRPWSDIIRTT
jgi:hypothetical protein